MRSARLDGCVYKLRNSALPPRNWGLFALPPPPSSHTFLSFLNFFRMDFQITAEFNLNWHLNVQSMWLCRNNIGYILNGFIRQKCFIFPQNQRQCPFTKIVKSRQLQFLNSIKKSFWREIRWNNIKKTFQAWCLCSYIVHFGVGFFATRGLKSYDYLRKLTKF